MNFWKQTTHVMSYFKGENFRGDQRLPSSFVTGFLEVGRGPHATCDASLRQAHRVGTDDGSHHWACVRVYSSKTVPNSPRNAVARRVGPGPNQ